MSEGSEPGRGVRHHLLGHLFGHAGPGAHQAPGPVPVALAQHWLEGGAQVAHRLGELGGPGRSLAEPERDRRRKVAGVVHAHRADLDLGHPPRMGTEQEDVARGGLDGEVLVHRAHGHAVGVEHDAVVTCLGDGAAAGQSGQSGAATGA